MKRAASQLLKEMEPAAITPLGVLAGQECADQARAAIEERAEEAVRALEAEEASVATSAVADAVLSLLFATDQPPVAWWDTALGHLVARHASDAAITHTMASEILQVERGTVSTLIKRGTLPTIEGTNPRKLSRAAVLARKLGLADKARAKARAAK